MSVLTHLNELCLIAYRLFHSPFKAGSGTAFVMNFCKDASVVFASDMLYSLRSLMLRDTDPKLSVPEHLSMVGRIKRKTIMKIKKQP